MRPLDVLERWLRPVAVPYLAALLAAVQVAVFVWVLVASPNDPSRVLEPMMLVPGRVLEGEWWRLVTFLAVPFTLHPLWALLGWICLAFIGNALEQHWGTARFNLFLLIGWAATVAVAFIAPGAASTNDFIMLSVFLAFATLAPETVFRVFLIIPVKAKWLALIAWIAMAYGVVVGTWGTRLAILAMVANWAAFFLPTVIRRARSSAARTLRAAVPAARTPFHRCVVCGRTDLSDPDLEFRYCGECDGAPGYCMEHLKTHRHVRRADTEPARAGR